MQDTIDIPTRQTGIPVINFNGSFLVESLKVGSLLISSKRESAVKILIHQTLDYPVLAHGRSAAEIYAYCFDARRTERRTLEAYVQCRLIADQQCGRRRPVIANITWYVSSDLREKCAQQVAAVLAGDVLGDAVYPEFQGKTFACFEEE